MTATNFDKIPAEMRNFPQWICWRLEERGGKSTKVPFRVDRKTASTVNPHDWSSFDVAVVALQFNPRSAFSGIGFVFAKSSGLVGIDIDKCRDPETGETETWAKAIILELNSYTELSQSGKGWHVIVRGVLPEGGNRRGRVEMYDQDRYFVMTGDRASDSVQGIAARDLSSIHARLLNGKLDPAPPTPAASSGSSNGTRHPDGTVDESAVDYKLIARIAEKRKTRNATEIERGIQAQYAERYQRRQEVKGNRGRKTYWQYSIANFLKSLPKERTNVRARRTRKQREIARAYYGVQHL